MEKTPNGMSLENITVYADFEQRVKEIFPGKKFSNEEMRALSILVRKSKKLGEVEKELKKSKKFGDFILKTSDEHVDFYKGQLKSEQAKGKIKNMVENTLKAKN